MAETRGIAQKQELMGRWWIPGSRRRSRQGTLTLPSGQERPILVLNGGLPTEPTQAAYEIIHGITASGVEFTLMNCVIAESRSRLLHRPAVVSQTIQAVTVLEGGHISNPKDAVWTDVLVRLRHFPERLAGQQFEESLESGESENGFWEIFRYEVPPDIECSTSMGNVRVTYGLEQSHAPGRHELTRFGSLHVQLHEQASFETIVSDVVRPLEYLFTLLCDSATPAESLKVAGPVKQVIANRRLPQYLIVHGHPVQQETQLASPQHYEMTLDLSRGQAHLPQLLLRWFERQSIF